MTVVSVFIMIHCPVHRKLLHSFPTRRSSDLPREKVQEYGREVGDPVREAMWPKEPLCVLADEHLVDEYAQWFLGPHGLAYRIRSEEHTSELQSLTNLVCRLLLEKKKTNQNKE